MQRIVLSQATAGMTLAKEIITPEGRVLCGKGTELTEPLLARLAKMEISSLTVQGHPVPDDSAGTLEDQLAALDLRFRDTDDIPVMQVLRHYLAEKLTASFNDHG